MNIDKLVESLWTSLECKEVQTKAIIKKFLEDIKLFDKKQHK